MAAGASARCTPAWSRWAPASTPAAARRPAQLPAAPGKELRYLLELFGGLWPSGVVKPMVRSLKGLQDVLGTHQDREVQSDHMRDPGRRAGHPGRRPPGAAGAGRARRPARRRAAGRPRPVRRPVRRLRGPQAAQAGGQDVRAVKVVATYNIKGGVGKTSAAVNLAALAAGTRLRTLLWDLDPQGCVLPVPDPAQGARRPEALVPRTQRRRRCAARAPTSRASTADFSYRHGPGARRVGQSHPRLRKVLAPLVASTTSRCSTARRRSRWCPRACSAADALLVPLIPSTLTLRTFEQLADFVDAEVDHQPDIVAFFSMVDQRKRLLLVESLPDGRADIVATAIPAATEVELMGVERSTLVVHTPQPGGARLRRAVGRAARPPEPVGAIVRRAARRCRDRGWRSSGSSAARWVGDRRRRHTWSASRSVRNGPRCAPCRGSCR